MFHTIIYSALNCLPFLMMQRDEQMWIIEASSSISLLLSSGFSTLITNLKSCPVRFHNSGIEIVPSFITYHYCSRSSFPNKATHYTNIGADYLKPFAFNVYTNFSGDFPPIKVCVIKVDAPDSLVK